MKKITILFMSLLCGFNAWAWDFISAGGTAVDEVTWSIGGYGTTTLVNNDQQVILTQGFLQPATFLPSRIQPAEEIRLKAYPNPVVNNLFVQSECMLTGWTLYDAAGRVIAQHNITPALHTNIDFDAYPKGCYTLSLQSEQRQIIVKVMK